MINDRGKPEELEEKKFLTAMLSTRIIYKLILIKHKLTFQILYAFSILSSVGRT